ncbi:MAG: Asp/Glu/hydantoin racemase [Oscillibacter sp.]|nr:Asp/Glu/hydantoin racemase [Oscillibacter sp.]
MEKTKKIAIIHTSLISHAELQQLFADIIPEAELINIVDDSLLKEVSANGSITPNIVHRMCNYFRHAEELGADLIFNQCSSVAEAAKIAAKTVNVPVLRVDEAMAEKAVSLGKRIGVVATVGSTVAPSCANVQEKADAIGKEVEIVPYLVDGAMFVLMREGKEAHNDLVMDTVNKCVEECDVAVLAQGSMTALIPRLVNMKKPVLTSPELGVRRAREILFGK